MEIKEVPTERPGIYRVDPGTLINKDMSGLQAYKLQKQRMKEISNLKEEMKSLKSDIDEIKSLLKGLVD